MTQLGSNSQFCLCKKTPAVVEQSSIYILWNPVAVTLPYILRPPPQPFYLHFPCSHREHFPSFLPFFNFQLYNLPTSLIRPPNEEYKIYKNDSKFFSKRRSLFLPFLILYFLPDRSAAFMQNIPSYFILVFSPSHHLHQLFPLVVFLVFKVYKTMLFILRELYSIHLHSFMYFLDFFSIFFLHGKCGCLEIT